MKIMYIFMRHSLSHTHDTKCGGKISEFSTLSITTIICWMQHILYAIYCQSYCGFYIFQFVVQRRIRWQKNLRYCSMLFCNFETVQSKRKEQQKCDSVEYIFLLNKTISSFFPNRKLWNWNAFWYFMPAFHPIGIRYFLRELWKSAVKWPMFSCVTILVYLNKMNETMKNNNRNEFDECVISSLSDSFSSNSFFLVLHYC